MAEGGAWKDQGEKRLRAALRDLEGDRDSIDLTCEMPLVQSEHAARVDPAPPEVLHCLGWSDKLVSLPILYAKV